MCRGFFDHHRSEIEAAFAVEFVELPAALSDSSIDHRNIKSNFNGETMSLDSQSQDSHPSPVAKLADEILTAMKLKVGTGELAGLEETHIARQGDDGFVLGLVDHVNGVYYEVSGKIDFDSTAGGKSVRLVTRAHTVTPQKAVVWGPGHSVVLPVRKDGSFDASLLASLESAKRLLHA